MLVKFSDNNYNSILFSNLHDQSAFLSAVRQVTIDERYQYATMGCEVGTIPPCPAKHAPSPRGPSNSFNIYTSAPTLSGNISGTGSGAKRTFCPPPGFMMPRHSAEVFFFKRTRSVTHLESTLIEVLIPSNSKFFRLNIYKKQGKRPLFAQFWCNVNLFRINTCKSVSKQRTLTPFRMNTYEKQGGGGQLLLTRIPAAQRYGFVRNKLWVASVRVYLSLFV